jgi:hypothetical protein
MIDYGAVAQLPDGIPRVLARILRHIANAEPEPMMRLLHDEGLVAGEVAPDDVLTYLGASASPCVSNAFTSTGVDPRSGRAGGA